MKTFIVYYTNFKTTEVQATSEQEAKMKAPSRIGDGFLWDAEEK